MFSLTENIFRVCFGFFLVAILCSSEILVPEQQRICSSSNVPCERVHYIALCLTWEDSWGSVSVWRFLCHFSKQCKEHPVSPEDLKSGSWGRASCRGGENQITPGLALSNPLIQKLMLFESHLPCCPAPAGTSNTDGQRSCLLRQPRAGSVLPDHWSSSHNKELANTCMIWLEITAAWCLKKITVSPQSSTAKRKGQN